MAVMPSLPPRRDVGRNARPLAAAGFRLLDPLVQRANWSPGPFSDPRGAKGGSSPRAGNGWHTLRGPCRKWCRAHGCPPEALPPANRTRPRGCTISRLSPPDCRRLEIRLQVDQVDRADSRSNRTRIRATWNIVNPREYGVTVSDPDFTDAALAAGFGVDDAAGDMDGYQIMVAGHLPSEVTRAPTGCSHSGCTPGTAKPILWTSSGAPCGPGAWLSSGRAPPGPRKGWQGSCGVGRGAPGRGGLP